MIRWPEVVEGVFKKIDKEIRNYKKVKVSLEVVKKKQKFVENSNKKSCKIVEIYNWQEIIGIL